MSGGGTGLMSGGGQSIESGGRGMSGFVGCSIMRVSHATSLPGADNPPEVRANPSRQATAENAENAEISFATGESLRSLRPLRLLFRWGEPYRGRNFTRPVRPRA